MNNNNQTLRRLGQHREELAEEERTLLEIRTSIQKQLNALDIERLHLRSAAKKLPVKCKSEPQEILEDDVPEDLDLNVPSAALDQEEEEDDEDL